MIAAMLAQAPEWPPVRGMPVASLREAVRSSSLQLPPPDVSLADVSDQRIPGPGGEIPVRIYTPQGDGPFPVVLYFHGGGFVVGDLDTQDMIARGLAGGAGALVISVDYRLAPEHKFPAAPEDAWAALGWAAAHAAELNGDPAKIAVAGDSAGGVLAIGLALQTVREDGPALCAQVNWYGPAIHPIPETGSAIEYANGPMLRMDDAHYFWELYLSNDSQFDDYRASALKAESHSGLPPAFIAAAECDPIRDSVEAYAPALQAAGVEVEMRRYAGMPHGFVSMLGFLPGAQAAMADACAFLKKRFA